MCRLGRPSSSRFDIHTIAPARRSARRDCMRSGAWRGLPFRRRPSGCLVAVADQPTREHLAVHLIVFNQQNPWHVFSRCVRSSVGDALRFGLSGPAPAHGGGQFGQIRLCLIGMEACVGAHHLSRRLKMLGHDARLGPALAQNLSRMATAWIEAVRAAPRYKGLLSSGSNDLSLLHAKLNSTDVCSSPFDPTREGAGNCSTVAR